GRLLARQGLAGVLPCDHWRRFRVSLNMLRMTGFGETRRLRDAVLNVRFQQDRTFPPAIRRETF
ncbi:MAG TPA: hypothetical protein VEU95_03770, partial [Micropepsaceae bacterium]|nr:hypothetical protein [Micropepsaceae bacterium]